MIVLCKKDFIIKSIWQDDLLPAPNYLINNYYNIWSEDKWSYWIETNNFYYERFYKKGLGGLISNINLAFDDYFISNKEMRKLKLIKLNTYEK